MNYGKNLFLFLQYTLKCVYLQCIVNTYNIYLLDKLNFNIQVSTCFTFGLSFFSKKKTNSNNLFKFIFIRPKFQKKRPIRAISNIKEQFFLKNKIHWLKIKCLYLFFVLSQIFHTLRWSLGNLVILVAQLSFWIRQYPYNSHIFRVLIFQPIISCDNFSSYFLLEVIAS